MNNLDFEHLRPSIYAAFPNTRKVSRSFSSFGFVLNICIGRGHRLVNVPILLDLQNVPYSIHARCSGSWGSKKQSIVGWYFYRGEPKWEMPTFYGHPDYKPLARSLRSLVAYWALTNVITPEQSGLSFTEIVELSSEVKSSLEYQQSLPFDFYEHLKKCENF